MRSTTGKLLATCAANVLLAVALSACIGNGNVSPKLKLGAHDSVQKQEALSFSSRRGFVAGEVIVDQEQTEVHSNHPSSSGETAMLTDASPSQAQRTSELGHYGAQSNVVPDTDVSDGGVVQEDTWSSDGVVVTATRPGSFSLAEPPRNNVEAADLLDNWGHRNIEKLTEELSLTNSVPGAKATDLGGLLAAAPMREGELLASNLQDDDEVRRLGSRRGVTYGRWAGGPADTLSIDFDLSRAGPAIQDDPAFRAMLERAGKVWSHRIADTWSIWKRKAGERKGRVLPRLETIRVGESGEISTGVEIYVTDTASLGAGAQTLVASDTIPPDAPWEPRFGSIEIDRDHLEDRERREAHLFRTLTHEIGHVLGAWRGGAITEPYADYSDEANGTWTGPNVIAIHGGPAPFQDAADPTTWMEGQRDPSASQYDFGHSGVCASLMSYCGSNAALVPFLPHAIDFAFLSDLGMTVLEETSRPETYGLAGWTDYAGFTVSVSRDLQVALADPQPHYDGANNAWHDLDIIDLMQTGVDVFGYRSTGGLRQSYPAEGVRGTVRYAGGLLGAAIDHAWLPPVTGDANLAVNLGTLDGTASFTALEVYMNGAPEPFADGALYYPFEVSSNAILGTASGSTLRADFYGPRHEDVAGALHDPGAGLLASFGATHDDRPSREDVVASSDYMVGLTLGTEGTSDRLGKWSNSVSMWHEYRCDPDCQVRSVSGGQNAWMPADEAQVLGLTAGWGSQSNESVDADYGFMQVTRNSQASTDGARGRHVVDSYAGTLKGSTFSTGFENYTDWLDEPDAENLSILGTVWSGVQGTLTGTPLDGVAGWSGKMLGYQQGHDAFQNPFVEGLATIRFSLSDYSLDVAFSEVASRDGEREVADFGFDNLRLESDGTFSLWDASGIISGGLFGVSHQEASAAFQHNATYILGSFGARRLPDIVTLEEAGTTTYEEGSLLRRHHFDDWGVWAEQFGQDIFGAFIDQENVGRRKGKPFPRIEGTPTGHNPALGSAVWSGEVRAFEAGSGIVDYSIVNYTPVSGRARLEVDFTDKTVDVDFTDFEAGHSNISWRALQLRDGAFRDGQFGDFTRDGDAIEGAFYGNEHQGVAGTFERNRLKGVFGAVRN